MIYDRSGKKEKWTLMMYMSDFNLMTTYAYALRASNELSSDNIDAILLDMEKKGIYRPRNGGSTFTGEFKAIQIAWYMFGYYNNSGQRGKSKKMVFSPLGNLLLDNLKDSEKVSKIFLTMMFGNGFRQPFSRMDHRFNIYAYRLIFKLLRDERIECKLYSDEVFYLAMFLKTVNQDDYEELVKDILELRSQNSCSKLKVFKDNEEVIGLACHEWRYASKILASAKILTINGGSDVGTLEYGNISPKTGKPTARRTYTEDYVTLKPWLFAYVDKLLDKYPYYEKPYPEEDVETSFSSDMVVEMYSFYPPELLEELGIESEEDQAITKMLTMAKDVNYYSHEETEGGDKFEYALELFSDVQARRVGGAGNTDVECIYMSTTGAKKFDLEAKATSMKLMSINSRRLRTHRIRVGSKYTLIVTPNFAYGVLLDIQEEDSAIIKSATLANFFYQNIVKNGRNLSYADLDLIIEGNRGKDITDDVNEYVYNNFGHGAKDLKIDKKKDAKEEKKPVKKAVKKPVVCKLDPTPVAMVAEEPASYGNVATKSSTATVVKVSAKVGDIVQHKAFGKGTVKSISDGMIAVRFGKEVKKFKFPDVFDKGFLTKE